MWVRKIVKFGNSKMVALPPEVLVTLDWERGDYVVLYISEDLTLVVTKFDPVKRPDLLHATRTNEQGNLESGKIDTFAD